MILVSLAILVILEIVVILAILMILAISVIIAISVILWYLQVFMINAHVSTLNLHPTWKISNAVYKRLVFVRVAFNDADEIKA